MMLVGIKRACKNKSLSLKIATRYELCTKRVDMLRVPILMRLALICLI